MIDESYIQLEVVEKNSSLYFPNPMEHQYDQYDGPHSM
jgi:hypothetical protein